MKQFVEDLENNMRKNSHIKQHDKVSFSFKESKDCPIIILNGIVNSYFHKQMAQTIVRETLKKHPELILKTINEIEVKK